MSMSRHVLHKHGGCCHTHTDMVSPHSFIAHSAPWVHNSGTMTPSRLRSLSPMPKNHVTRSISTPQLAKTAQSQSQSQTEADGMNTIPDPRSATPQPPLSRHDSTDSHPDLSQEVSTLSTKLINAINHSTMLDDSLQATRHELEAAREKLLQLEAQVKEHEDKVSKGLLVEKVVYDKMEKQLSIELQEERKRRAQAEAAKRKTDNEVETLTAALFEEANVVSAVASSITYKTNTYRWSLLHARRRRLPRNVANSSSNNWATLRCFNILSRTNYKTSKVSWRR